MKSLVHVAIATRSVKESTKIVLWFKAMGINTREYSGQATEDRLGMPSYYYVTDSKVLICVNNEQWRSIIAYKEAPKFKVFKSLSQCKAWFKREYIEIKFKPEFDDKLREFSIRTKFIYNMKRATAPDMLRTRIEILNRTTDWESFISRGFQWDETPVGEGVKYWGDISKGINPNSI